jgi:hypothetical protein
MESLEVHVIDRLHQLEGSHGLSDALQALGAQAEQLRRQLKGANERFTRRLRHRIHDGRFTRRGLERAFRRRAGASGGHRTYDTLDLLIGGLLEAGRLPKERALREPDMVAYQPTPGRMILQLLERAEVRANDVVIDLGSGLGWVVILVAALSEARAIGIEFEPTYCDYARRSALALNLSRAEFIHADVREASLASGTVFFLFTPFRGRMLREVLERLSQEARERPIRVCTYGPCTAEVARASWLAARAGSALSEHEVVVFDRGR